LIHPQALEESAGAAPIVDVRVASELGGPPGRIRGAAIIPLGEPAARLRRHAGPAIRIYSGLQQRPTISEGETMNEQQLPQRPRAQGITQLEIDQRVFDLYDEYCHGRIDRREFLSRAASIAALGGTGLVMAQALLPRYALAQTVSFTDQRIKASYVTYPSAGGNSGTMRGYLVQPAGQGPFPAVLVVHENRGLNPYIEDVARRAAVEGFLALAPDGLFPVGG
jgi:hypothetical protein